MCCTFELSKMSNTRLYVGQGKRKGEPVHVLAYQNNATSSGPNAMVIPFPTNAKMTEDNIIDTTEFKEFLNDITEASRIRSLSFSLNGDMLFGAACAGSAKVFNVGSYTVILAEKISQIPEALTRVSEDRRPKVSVNFLLGYDRLYSNQPIAICCWNGTIEAEPLLWWYEPKNKDELFIPTMDAHDGLAPKVGNRVETDHIISVNAKHGNKVFYCSNIPDDTKELLPTHVLGHQLSRWMNNDDCLVKTAELSSQSKKVMLNRGTGYQKQMLGWS